MVSHTRRSLHDGRSGQTIAVSYSQARNRDCSWDEAQTRRTAYPCEGAAKLAHAVPELLRAARQLRDAADAAEEVFLIVQDVRADGRFYARDVRGHALENSVAEGETEKQTAGGGI